MNRRQLIRSAVGAGAAAASLPVLAKVAQANDRAYMGAPTCSAPEWKEPPLDTRTPEQVMEDSQQEWAASIVKDLHADYSKYRKYVYSADADLFKRVEALLVKENRPFERRSIAGKDCLIVNGNVLMTPTILYVYTASGNNNNSKA